MKKYPQKIKLMREKALDGNGITFSQAVSIHSIPDRYLPLLWAASSEVRDTFKDRKVRICCIVNAKSGTCSENCAFCAQSAHYNTGVKTYSLKKTADLVRAGQKAFRNGSCEFSIVTSGLRVSEKDLHVIEKAVKELAKHNGKAVCASLGIIPKESLERLKKAGLTNFHHNIETSRTFFKNICTTHDYEESICTVKDAAEAGLNVCCGGIFGVGEDFKERVKLVFEAKKLPAFSFPVNFLYPIPGTPLEHMEVLAPLDALKIIAMVRLSLPKRNVIVCGGREKVLKELLPMIFLAGANGLLAGGYLTTKGRNMADDINMIKQQGFGIA